MSTAADTSRDDRLAIALDSLMRNQAAGKPIDIDAIEREHPDLADELKQLLAVGRIVDFVKVHSSITAPTPKQTLSSTINLPSTFGPYELIEEIGRGGMGIVYKAWEPSLQRHVAIKMILRGIHATAADLGRFRSEAQAAAVA